MTDCPPIVQIAPAALRPKAAALYLGVGVEFLQSLPIQPVRVRGNGRRGKVMLLYVVSELDAWLATEAQSREPQMQHHRRPA